MRTITHLSADSSDNGVEITTKTVNVELSCIPPNGVSYISPLVSAPCGSDGGPKGYYWGDRFTSDWADTDRLEENLTLMHQQGMESGKFVRTQLLHIPNHEGVAEIVQTAANPAEYQREIPAFKLVVEDGNITGATYSIESVDFQTYKEGDWVVPNAALRCDKHWQIDPETHFPKSCHRGEEAGHTNKRVPGHTEIPGYSFTGVLPYPNQMLTKIPDSLKKWAQQHPAGKYVLSQVEPLSCAFEAYIPLLMKSKKAKTVVVGGDGPNAALLILVALVVFPECTVYVTGRTKKKLDAIQAIAPERIKVVAVSKEDLHGMDAIAKMLDGEQADVVIPTYHISELKSFDAITKPDGTLVIWSADQVGDESVVEGVNASVHHSYGGWNQAEWTAVQFLDVVANVYPSMLEALYEYPYAIKSIEDGAVAMNEWLQNKGRYSMEIDGEKTSGKILIDHTLTSEHSE